MRFSALRFCLLFFFFGLLLFSDGGAAWALPPAESISTTQFWQRVEQSATTLRGLKGQPKEKVEPALDALADEWSRFDALTAPSGDTPFGTSVTVSLLRQRPYDLEAIIQHFTNLQDARRLSSTRSFETADLASLQPILQQAEFQWDRPPSPLEDLWSQFWAKVNKWLEELLGRDELNIPVPTEAFTIGASVVLLLILLYVFRNLFSDFFMDASAKDEQMAGDELLTAESALQKAKDISKGGDYRTAVRYLYISSLLTLDERGLMRFDRSKTNREYLRSVATLPQLSTPLREVIDVFDRVWYGFQPLDEETFQHYAEKVDQLREQKK